MFLIYCILLHEHIVLAIEDVCKSFTIRLSINNLV